MILVPVTILNGSTLSEPVGLNGSYVARIDTPTTLTSTSLGFEISVDGTTYRTVVDETGTPVAISSPANKSISLPQELTHGAVSIRLKAGSAEAADRTFTLAVNRI